MKKIKKYFVLTLLMLGFFTGFSNNISANVVRFSSLNLPILSGPVYLPVGYAQGGRKYGVATLTMMRNVSAVRIKATKSTEISYGDGGLVVFLNDATKIAYSRVHTINTEMLGQASNDSWSTTAGTIQGTMDY